MKELAALLAWRCAVGIPIVRALGAIRLLRSRFFLRLTHYSLQPNQIAFRLVTLLTAHHDQFDRFVPRLQRTSIPSVAL
jgi:hypothetical protein